MANIKEFVFNHFEENTYIVWDDSKQCIIIDPGMNSAAENSKLAEFVSDNGLTVGKVLLTHAHIDHIAGLRFVCETYNLPITAHADSMSFLKQAESYGSMMGFGTQNMDDLAFEAIDDNAVIAVGTTEIKALYVPGHAAGSMAYVLKDPNVVFTGDALFRHRLAYGRLRHADENAEHQNTYARRRLRSIARSWSEHNHWRRKKHESVLNLIHNKTLLNNKN